MYNMKSKLKVNIIYAISILAVLSTMSTSKNMPFIERVLRRLGITSFHSQGDTGWYYPTLVVVAIVILSWYLLHKTDSESKYVKYYLYYLSGIVITIALAAQFVTKVLV